jgi:hypothetical protein
VLKIASEKVSRKKAVITIQQVQDYLFDFPLELEVLDDQGQRSRKKININSKTSTLKMKVRGKIQEVIIDPEVRLLFEEG